MSPGRARFPSARLALSGAVIVALVAAGILAWTPAGPQFSAWIAAATSGTHAQVAPPLIFGTNLTLYDSSDQIINSVASQDLLKAARVPIIRLPFRSAQGDVDELRALRAIQYIGAIPVVIVHGPDDPTAVADDRMLVQLVRNVFGSGRVYVEYGNEPDLAGYSARQYANSWNATVPALKAIAPGYLYIGPSTSAAEPAYIAEFDRLAQPRPDANTWHEYACTAKQPDSACMNDVATWTQHVQWVNDSVHKTIGDKLPVMITEWNLDADPDPRFADTTFMRSWTALALRTLAENMPQGLAAAIQYCVASNQNFSLIAPDNSLTPEGQAFFQTLATSTRR